jgi:hypothetical protein
MKVKKERKASEKRCYTCWNTFTAAQAKEQGGSWRDNACCAKCKAEYVPWDQRGGK